MIYLYNKLTYLYYTLYYIIDIYRVLLKYFHRKKIIYIDQSSRKEHVYKICIKILVTFSIYIGFIYKMYKLFSRKLAVLLKVY